MRAKAAILTFILLVVAARNGAIANAESTQQHAIDPAKSTARFRIEHIFVDRVTGTLPILRGSIDLPENSSLPVSVTAILDATKIDTADRDRDLSLESPDYFDTQQFPTWTFTSTTIEPSGATTFGMDGMLTMHGVTQREHLDVSIHGDAAHPVYHATGHIDRHAFGMKGARLDPVIGNVADVTLDIVVK